MYLVLNSFKLVFIIYARVIKKKNSFLMFRVFKGVEVTEDLKHST